MEPKTIPLRAVIYKRDDVWFAQCLEHDILAHSKTPKDLLYRLERAVESQMAIAADNGLSPLEDIRPAPKRFWRMYDSGMKVAPPTHHSFTVRNYSAVPTMTELSVAELV